MTKDGIEIESGIVQDLDIYPHATEDITLGYTHTHTNDGDYYLNLSFVQKTSTPWASRGYEVAFAQFELAVAPKISIPVVSTLECVQTTQHITLIGEDFKYSFNTFTGSFESLTSNGVELLAACPQVSVWRAPTDNDRNIYHTWRGQMMHCSTAHVYQTGISEKLLTL